MYNDDLLKTTSYINLQSSEQTGGKLIIVGEIPYWANYIFR